ncbi:neuronal acetylcholine receptor subunit alpha-6-like [Mercenaria mercenaria]|uniref:neuronal acetylcholine receptor subunit alpha-6-like n=1 Tax=Mercenaria mercenaria TaxID=6596 RepID=UPI00234EB560|nr:neuronal acetylcholine receptor subunit alpha-6-like [Mercenaria mercenaria]
MAVWAPGDVMTTTCNIDITYYPFDTQTCDVTFIPWGSMISEMNLHVAQKEVSRRLFTENGEWALQKATTATGLFDGIYPTYSVVLELKRRPTFVVVNVILPVLFMGFLNVLVFFLPAKSGERVSFAMTVLLAFAVFLTLVGDNMPKTSKPISALCYFLLNNLILSSLIMTATIVNLNIYHKDDNISVPQWLATIVRTLNCMQRPKRTKVGNLDERDRKADNKKMKSENLEADPDDLPVYLKDRITWCDISKTLDFVFGAVSILWHLITAVAFFILVV